MKIAVIGGGSTYSPELLHGLAAQAASLGLSEVALFDTDPERLEIVGGFARRMCRPLAPHLKVTLQQRQSAALEGARFVIVQIRVGGQAARLEDERLGKDHGVIGQETTGVGGMAKALRTIPALLQIARDVEAHAPGAALINFSNPVSVVTEALIRHATVQTIGLCNIPISQRMEIASHLGVAPAEIEIDSVGLNHLSFIRSVKRSGREILPELIDDVSEILGKGHRPANIPDLDFPPLLLKSLKMIPSDYLRYYFLAQETVQEQIDKTKLRAEEVMAIEAELLTYYSDESNHEKPAMLAQRGGAHYSHAALEIVEAIVHDTGARLIVDVENGTTLSELGPHTCIEVPCRVGAAGATPLPQAPLPPEIRGLIQHVKAYEELTVRAALSQSEDDIYLAVLSHPLTNSATIAEAVTRRLIHRLGG